MSTASFEFSVADANAVPAKTPSKAKNQLLDVSLEEIIQKEKQEKKEKYAQNRKDRGEKKGDRTSKKPDSRNRDDDKNRGKKQDNKRDITTSRNTRREENKDIQNSRKQQPNKTKFEIKIPENIIRDLLVQAGVRPDDYDISVIAVPKYQSK